MTFLPILFEHNAPNPTGRREYRPSTEPIYISTQFHETRRGGDEYLTFWYVGQIPEDAVRPSLFPCI